MNDFPRIECAPGPRDIVQVLMTEEMARRFEAELLSRTAGDCKLSPPLQFSESDVPTYIIVPRVMKP